MRQRKSKSGWLDEIDQLVAWPDLVGLFDHVYASAEGGASYPIETYVKLLLLQQWYALIDEGLEAAVDDRLPFRRFCGIPLDRPVPDHSSIWRFRQHLTEKDEAGLSLGERLLATINRQLDEKGLVLKRGTLIDASIIKSAARPPKGDVGEVSPVDPDAGFTKKNCKTFFGYKANVGVDALVDEHRLTPFQLLDLIGMHRKAPCPPNRAPAGRAGRHVPSAAHGRATITA